MRPFWDENCCDTDGPLQAADVNRDGRLDVLQAGIGVSIRIGNGDGTFGFPTRLSTRSNLQAFLATDINGDGSSDLVTTHGTNNNVVSVRFGNGAGGFGTAIDTPASITFGSAISGCDLNGDRRVDLAFASGATSGVSVLLGDGFGRFTAAPPLSGPAGQTDLTGLVCADLNRDGTRDLAGLFWRSNTLRIWLGNGDGTFAQPLSVTTGPRPFDLTAEDFNGDGVVDLAVTNLHGNSISLYRGNGDGSMATASVIPAGPEPRKFGVADFNGDGNLDLVVTDLQKIALFVGNGDGTFAPRIDFGTKYPTLQLATADFDGDALVDVLGRSDHNWVFMRNDPHMPVADAGPDIYVQMPSRVTLVGTGWDPDGGPLQFQWYFPGVGYATGSTVTTTASQISEFELTVTDATGRTSVDRGWFFFPNGNRLTLQAPNGGGTYVSGSDIQALWAGTDAERFNLWLALDGGDFEPVAACQSLPGTARACTFAAPPTASPVSALLRVERVASGITDIDDSDRPFTIVPPPSSTAPEIVIYAGDVPETSLHGWTRDADTTAAGGVKLTTPDTGRDWFSGPLANPTDYFDVTFSAPADVAYRVWLRLRATGDTKFSESVWVQFSNAIVDGAPAYRMGSTSGLLVNLEACSGCGVSGWGWQDRAWWLTQSSIVTFAAGGAQAMRIQLREDGVQIDQIVLSPERYLTQSPGSLTNDETILPRSPAHTQPQNIVVYASDLSASDLHGSWTIESGPGSPNGVKAVTPDAGAPASSQPLAAPTDYIDVPVHVPASGSYRLWLRLRAKDDTKWNESVWVQFSNATQDGGAAYPIGSTSGLLVNLEDCSGCGVSAWGWMDSAWWLSQSSTIELPMGTTTIRIQVREDGVELDQIVLSPEEFRSTAPGTVRDDTVIVPKPGFAVPFGG